MPSLEMDSRTPAGRPGPNSEGSCGGDNPVDAVAIEGGADDAWAMILRDGCESTLSPVIYIDPTDGETYIANGRWVPPSAEFLGHAIEADETRSGKLQRRIPRHSPDPLIGDLVEGRYLIERELGRGSVAVAYLARDVGTDSRYVVKQWTNPERDMAQAENEMKVLSDLNHRNVPMAWDARRLGGPFHLRLEYVPGRPLHEIAGQDASRRVEVMDLASTVLEVLMAAASPDPGRRPPSARAFARRLREAAGIEPGG
jgi:hypothetical protein